MASQRTVALGPFLETLDDATNAAAFEAESRVMAFPGGAWERVRPGEFRRPSSRADPTLRVRRHFFFSGLALRMSPASSMARIWMGTGLDQCGLSASRRRAKRRYRPSSNSFDQ